MRVNVRKVGRRTEGVRVERLNIALHEDDLELIRKAAHADDRKIANFVLHAALNLARTKLNVTESSVL